MNNLDMMLKPGSAGGGGRVNTGDPVCDNGCFDWIPFIGFCKLRIVPFSACVVLCLLTSLTRYRVLRIHSFGFTELGYN